MIPVGHRILIVDDDSGIRRLLAAYLSREGFQIVEARNGREALEVMRAGKADLVLLDLLMPEVSGLEVLRERAADAVMREIPVIVVSASLKRDVTAAVLDQDIRGVLTKPFDLDALLAIVTVCLKEPPHVPTSVAA